MNGQGPFHDYRTGCDCATCVVTRKMMSPPFVVAETSKQPQKKTQGMTGFQYSVVLVCMTVFVALIYLFSLPWILYSAAVLVMFVATTERLKKVKLQQERYRKGEVV